MSDNGNGATSGAANGESKIAVSKSRPTKPLPTPRIQLSNQFDIMRAYAAISGPSKKAVKNKDVAEVVGMVESTISMNNSFLTEIGLLAKVGRGQFVPSDEVASYHRAHEWNPETAAHKLAPAIRKTWFGALLITRLSFQPMSHQAAVRVLAEEAAASKKYEKQVELLIDYLTESGIAVVENGQIRLGPTSKPGAGVTPPTGTAPKPEPVEETNSQAEPAPSKPAASVHTAFASPTEGVVQFHVSVKVDMAEFKGWEADRIASFFGGIAQVLAAKGALEESASG